MGIDWQRLFQPQPAPGADPPRHGHVHRPAGGPADSGGRHVGSLSLMDLLLMVLIADAAQNAMGDNYHSITEGRGSLRNADRLNFSSIGWRIVIRDFSEC